MGLSKTTYLEIPAHCSKAVVFHEIVVGPVIQESDTYKPRVTSEAAVVKPRVKIPEADLRMTLTLESLNF